MLSSKKYSNVDGATKRFLSDFIIESEQHCRVYLYRYTPNCGLDNTCDLLVDGVYNRLIDAPSVGDLVTLDKFDLIDNSIVFYTTPPVGTTVAIEVATTPEEFGGLLTVPFVEQAQIAATTATTQAALATTQAGIATTQAGIATTQAGIATTQAGLSAGSASSSATSATASATSASAAATSETNAALSASAAATSETNAALSASAAATSATNAATSAVSANTSATNAALSASSAATSETNALLYLNDFKGRYYGPLTSDPLLDPLGNPINVGDLYFNSTDNVFKVYNGVVWILSTTTASNVSNIPFGTISATTVQDAINELDTEKAPLSSPSLTGTPTINGVNISPYGKNYIINGNFDRWEYATSQTTIGYGSDNRWYNSNVGSTKTHSQIACADTERALFNAMFFSRTAVTSVAGAGNYVTKLQKIENVTKLAGKTVTLSFWAKADTAKNIAIELNQVFGTGGTPSTAVEGIGSQLVALTSTWQKFSITVTIPSIVGKTLGTDGVHTSSTIMGFWFDAGSNFNTRTANLGQQSGTFDIAQVQLEEGSVATPWSPYFGEFGGEVQACQRYYETGNLDAGSGGSFKYANGAGAGYFNSINSFLSEKRVSPTVAVGTPTYVNSSTIIIAADQKEIRTTVTTAAAGIYRANAAVWTASAEL